MSDQIAELENEIRLLRTEADMYRGVLEAAVRNLTSYVGPPGASRHVEINREELGMTLAAFRTVLDMAPTRQRNGT